MDAYGAPGDDLGAGGAGSPGKAKRGKKKITADSVGATCRVEDYACTGTIRFVGPHHETGKARVGVELAEPLAKSSGTFKGHQYFACAKKHGVLTVPSKVTLLVRAKRSRLHARRALRRTRGIRPRMRPQPRSLPRACFVRHACAGDPACGLLAPVPAAG